LSPDERIDLLGDAWDSKGAEPSDVPVPEWHLRELDRRLASPDPVFLPWEEVRDRLRTSTDVESAKAWCEERRNGLGNDFLQALEQVRKRLF